MALSRSEAIELAVRRHMKSRPKPYDPVEEIDCITIMSVNAIRAHFRAIVRTYGVVDEPPAVFWQGLRIRVPDEPVYDPPEYDGHSMRH